MTAVQPALDGTVPAQAADYQTWVDDIRPAFVTAARSGREFTTYEIARDAELPEPPNPRSDWGNATQLFERQQLIEHVAFDRSRRPTGERSAVSVWRGTKAAREGRIA
ncbi:MAG: hypothetical protein HOY75_13420 [Streptomyces sp.]|nr:hypothetical protein [Streptomyces sp.]